MCMSKFEDLVQSCLNHYINSEDYKRSLTLGIFKKELAFDVRDCNDIGIHRLEVFVDLRALEID